uniref:Uncharacterized protein n=1 Tax=Palpitomonas bilix TaxID=652834 RepID=A0A7S3G917_9EUKA|mmetsp:Transcript_40100/g.103813  ORF Transcript_40100/g.103813 Transcript_40100/m.103813 type:complete len:235 (+) Transcript_40100:1131-1835(+)
MKRDIPDHEEFAYEDEFAYEGEESSFIRKEHGDHEKDSVQEREARLRIGTDIANAWSEFAPRWKRTVQQLKIPFRLSRSLSIWRSFWLELKSQKGTKSNAMLFVKAAKRLLCVDSSSSASERAFSALSRVIKAALRSPLDPSFAAKVLIHLNSNLTIQHKALMKRRELNASKKRSRSIKEMEGFNMADVDNSRHERLSVQESIYAETEDATEVADDRSDDDDIENLLVPFRAIE